MRCNRFGCECCTCLKCNRYYSDCQCDVKARADAFIHKHYGTENPDIQEAIDIMETIK